MHPTKTHVAWTLSLVVAACGQDHLNRVERAHEQPSTPADQTPCSGDCENAPSPAPNAPPIATEPEPPPEPNPTCDGELVWDGARCVEPYDPRAGARCVERAEDSGVGVVNMDWYWVDSDGTVTELREACPNVSRGISCSDVEGCCSPAGVAINGWCTTYAPLGAPCYASPQCAAPLVCKQGVCADP